MAATADSLEPLTYYVVMAGQEQRSTTAGAKDLTNCEIRKARPEDAPAIWTVADSRSKRKLLSRGASEEYLSGNGFLLYPLEAQSEDQPSYRERIELSDQVWLATGNELVIAFVMAYTFRQMKGIPHLTANDLTVLDYFMNQWVCDANCIYLAQAATLPGHANGGVMLQIFSRFLADSACSGAPAVIGEVSQNPMNGASSALMLKAGFRMVATRIKNDPTTGLDRTSGTFVHTLPVVTP